MAKIPMNDNFDLDKFDPYKDTLVTTVHGTEEEVREVLDKLMGGKTNMPEYKTMVFSKKKWMECPLPDNIREDALQCGWVDKCDGKPVENGQCGQFLIVDTWCVDADEWEACDDA